MERPGGRSAEVVGRFESGVAGIGDLSTLVAAAPHGREGFQKLSLPRFQLEASARSSEASWARHPSPFASGRVRVQVVRA
jgi:hypothetical protein